MAQDTNSKRQVKTRSRKRKFSVPGIALSDSRAGEGVAGNRMAAWPEKRRRS